MATRASRTHSTLHSQKHFFSPPHSRLAHSPRSAAHCPPLLTPSRVRLSLFARTRETCSMRNMREEVLKLLKETLPSVCHANKVMQKEASQSPVNCQCSASWRIIRKLHTCPVAAALEIFMGERARAHAHCLQSDDGRPLRRQQHEGSERFGRSCNWRRR